MDNEWAGGFVKSDGSDVCKERCVREVAAEPGRGLTAICGRRLRGLRACSPGAEQGSAAALGVGFFTESLNSPWPRPLESGLRSKRPGSEPPCPSV
jgi:hypothetical protein